MKYRENDSVVFVSAGLELSGSIVNAYDDSYEVQVDNKLYNVKKEEIKKCTSKTVMCYLEKNDSFLMLLRNKRKADLNEGKWIGVGGHVDIGESPLAAIKREVKEETGLSINSLVHRAHLEFEYGSYFEHIEVFHSSDFTGDVIECDEGELHWIKKEEIFNLNLWQGDRIFLKDILNNNDYFEMKLVYDGDTLLNYNYI